MAERGAPEGNQNAVKSKRIFTSALKRLLTQSPERAEALAEKLITFAEAGEGWAFKELIDRLDGKAPQPIVGDDESDPIRLEQVPLSEVARRLAFLLNAGVKENDAKDTSNS